MTTRVGLSRPQWRHFTRRSWEKGISRWTLATPLVSSAELFAVACRLGRRARGSPGAPSFLGTDAGIQPLESTLLPRAADRTFEGHRARLRRRFGERFLVYARSLQDYAPELMQRVDAFLAPLRAEGLRWAHVELELYAGSYAWTPIGVHREPCGNFHHVVAGRKSILTWPNARFAPLPSDPRRAVCGGLAAKRELVTSAASRSAGAGQVIYFPSNCWHVGLSHGPSVALDVALYELAGEP